MRKIRTLAIGSLALLTSACTPELKNAFIAVTEEFGNLSSSDSGSGGGSGGESSGSGTARFRDSMTITFTNVMQDPALLEIVNPELNTSLVAWVLPSSIRSADQQDALLNDGYVATVSEIKIGTAFTLPPGTFVLNGAGTAGARKVLLGQGESETITFITPDAILIYDQPPTTCDSVAFYFTENGFLLDEFLPGDYTYPDALTLGSRKPLALVDAYACQPLRPGLFLRTTGAASGSNEYSEGQDVDVQFTLTPFATGFCTQITIN